MEDTQIPFLWLCRETGTQANLMSHWSLVHFETPVSEASSPLGGFCFHQCFKLHLWCLTRLPFHSVARSSLTQSHHWPHPSWCVPLTVIPCRHRNQVLCKLPTKVAGLVAIRQVNPCMGFTQRNKVWELPLFLLRKMGKNLKDFSQRKVASSHWSKLESKVRSPFLGSGITEFWEVGDGLSDGQDGRRCLGTVQGRFDIMVRQWPSFPRKVTPLPAFLSMKKELSYL